MTYNLEELLALSNDALLNMRGKRLSVQTTDDKVFEGVATGF